MTAIATTYCPNHPTKYSDYWLYTDRVGYGFCQECYEWLGKVHQLIITVGKKTRKNKKI